MSTFSTQSKPLWIAGYEDEEAFTQAKLLRYHPIIVVLISAIERFKQRFLSLTIEDVGEVADLLREDSN